MNQPPIDADIRQQALAIDESFAVSAPAGSGKTGLLTQRVLNLLAIADQPENILAMTFTRKAADEMHHRIISALHLAENDQYQTDNPHQQLTLTLAKKVLARDQERGWQLLIATHRLRIQTIDSFCQYLVDQLPIRSGIYDALRTTETPEYLYQHSVREFLSLLKHPTYQHDMGVLLGHVDNNLFKLENLLVELLRKRNQWLGVLYKSTDAEAAAEVIHDSLQRNIEDCLALCNQAMQTFLPELVPLLQYAANNKNDNERFEFLENFNLNSASLSEKLTLWQTIANNLLTNNANPDNCTMRKTVDARMGFPASKDKNSVAYQHRQTMLTLLVEIADQNVLLNYLRDVKALPPLESSGYHSVIKSLTKVLPRLVAQFQLTCREFGECDFDEVTQAALAALGDEQAPTDLALRLDYKIKHILVDEFQDTSLQQLLLLEKLTSGWHPDDGRTLFVVGDAMQSCYGFRDAKVGLFLRVRQQGIGDIPLTPLDLTVNFRSDSVIVNWVNRVFSQALPQQDNLRRGAVRYRHAQASNKNQDASVQLLGFQTASEQALHIKTIVEQHLKGSDHDTIAILARTRNHLVDILAVLRDANINWEAQDVDALRSQMAVVDLLSLTKAMCNLADRISWLACLRAPWCGLDMNDLTLIATGKHTIWEQILNYEELDLSTAGQHIVKRFKNILSAAFANSHRLPFRQWLEGIWLALGGENTISNPTETQSTKHYFDLLEQHCRGWSIRDWDQFEQALERLYATSPHKSRVQVMTMHKSKGLEFDVVVLPHLEKISRSDTKDLLLWEDNVDGHGNINFLLTATAPIAQQNPLYDYLWREQNIARELESTRLLYVACTRAIKHLYLCACLPEDEQGNRKPPAAKSLLAKLWPTIADDIQFLPSAQPNTPAAPTDDPPLNKILRLPPDRSAVVFPLDETLAPYRRPAFFHQQDIPNGDRLRNRHHRYCGTVIHRALEIACSQGWQQFDVDSQQPLWSLQLQELGIATTELAPLLAIIRAAVTKTLADPRGQWLLDNRHVGSVCEWRLSGLASVIDKTSPREWVIDRSFIDQGVRWVIDYKSSIPEPNQTEDEFLIQEATHYQSQLQAYHRAVCALDSQYPVQTALYFPRLAQFYPVSMDNFQ